MSENSYSLIHEQQRKIVVMSKGYLDKNSEKTKELLLKHGICPKCDAAQSDFHICLCEQDTSTDAEVWITSIGNENWKDVEPYLEKDRLRINSANRAAIRVDNFRYCPGFHIDEDINKIRSIQGDTCYFCDVDLLGIKTQIDHLTSVANEGSEWPSNLAITCVVCNRLKGSMNESEYWNVQKTRMTPEHFRTLSTKRRNERPLKKKLDAIRLGEVKERILYLQTAINAATHPATSVNINIEYRDEGIAVISGNFELVTLPYAHRKLMMLKDEKIMNWATTFAQLNQLLQF